MSTMLQRIPRRPISGSEIGRPAIAGDDRGHGHYETGATLAVDGA
jgi:hypothetical protein